MTGPEPFLAWLKRRWMTELWLIIYFATLLAFVAGYAMHHRPIPANERAAMRSLELLVQEDRPPLPGEPTTLEHGAPVLTNAGYHLVIYPREGGWIPGTDRAGPGEPFIAYAWPVQAGLTGNRAFVITEVGQLFETANRGYQQYSGDDLPPQLDTWRDLVRVVPTPSILLTPALHVVAPTFATDGFLWTPVE
jgi:hypothetical protein